MATDGSGLNRGPKPLAAPPRPRSAPAVGPDELEAAARAAEGLFNRFDRIVSDMANRAAQFVTEDIQHDLREQFQAAVEGNVDAFLQLLTHRVALEEIEPVDASVEYSTRLAHRGVPAYVLLNMYQAAQDLLLDECFEAVEALECSAGMKLRVLHYMSSVVHRFTEWMELHLIAVYEHEREIWSMTSGNVRYALVLNVIEGADVEVGSFEEEVGYFLDQFHVGLVAWTYSVDRDPGVLREVERGAQRLVEHAGVARAPLFAAVDRGTAWVWIPRGQRSDPLPSEQVEAAFGHIPGCRVAVGLACSGIEGFRLTHRQAQGARAVAVRSPGVPPQVVGYANPGVALLSMLTGDFAGDENAVRDWARWVLGPLADSSDNVARLRETLLVFLETGGSLVATAKRMSLHRNSVAYRIQRARELRGRDIDDDRADLELALRLAFHLAL